MKKILLILTLIFTLSCVSLSVGYFAKDAEFFLKPEHKILFMVRTGDLNDDMRMERAFLTVFRNNGFTGLFSLKQIDPMHEAEDKESFAACLTGKKIDYVVSVILTSYRNDVDYIPAIAFDFYGDWYGGYLITSLYQTYAVAVADSNGRRYALLQFETDWSWNLFENEDDVYLRLAKEVLVNLTETHTDKENR